MPTRNDQPLSRVVVVLDAAADLAPSIDIAASIARSLELELHALLLEDENLQRLAGLPFMQEVDLATARRAALDPDVLRREIEMTAGRIRRLLENRAAEQPLAWSFEVRQAAIGAELAGLRQDELLALGMASRPVMGMARMRSPWCALASRSRRPMLLIAESPAAEGGVVALHGSRGAGERGIGISARIARAWRKPLTVLVPVGIAAAERTAIEAQVHSEMAQATLRVIAKVSPEALRGYIVSASVSLAVLSRESLSGDGDLESFLGAPPSSLLLL